MKRTVQKVVTGLALLGAVSVAALQSAPAQAAPASQHRWNHPINQRQTHQQKRIFQGVHSGDLTNREAGHLESREARAANASNRSSA